MDEHPIAKGYLYETILGLFDGVFSSKSHLSVGHVDDDGACAAKIKLKREKHLQLDTVLMSVLLDLEDTDDTASPIWLKYGVAISWQKVVVFTYRQVRQPLGGRLAS
jgi:hypothetical protein